MSAKQKLRLGEILIQAGLLTESQLRSALGQQRWWGGHLGATLVGMELVSESALTRALASQLELPIVTLTGKQIHPEILELVPAELALKHEVVPLFLREEVGLRTLFVGIGDPTDLDILPQIQAEVGMPAKAVVVPPSELRAALDRFYGCPASLDDFTSPAAVGASPAGDSSTQILPLAELQPEPQLSESLEVTGAAVLSPALVVKALAQLLIDKGVIEHQELNTKVQALQVQTGKG